MRVTQLIRSFKEKLILVIIIFYAILPVPASAVTIYVAADGTGNFNTDGTDDQVEINQAISSAVDGDTVQIKAGTYNITDAINVNKNITLEGEYSNAIIKIVATGFHGIYIYNSNQWLDNVIVQNLKVQQTLTDNTVPYKGAITTFHADNVMIRNIVAEGINGVSKGRVGVLLGQGKPITVDNVSVYNFADQGIGTEFWDNPGHPAGTDITISSCTIDGNGYTIYGIKLSPALPNTGVWALRNTVKNCKIYNTARYGIWLYQGKNYWVGYERILNNTLYNNGLGTADAGGIGVLDQANVLIDGNTIYNNEQGIIVWPQSANANEDINYTISNNNIYNNYQSGIFLGMYSGSTASRLFDSSIYNNRVYNNSKDGISIDEANDVSIYSNTLYNNGNGIYDYASGTNHQVKNNIVADNLNFGLSGSPLNSTYNDVWSNAQSDYSGLTVGPGDFSQEPLFADVSTGDFHLLSQYGRWTPAGWVTTDTTISPCIGVGDPAADNSQSPWGGIIEMGAYGNTVEASAPGAVELGNISGVVKDTSNSPLAGVTVSALGSTQTDSNGNYLLNNVLASNRQVTAAKSGYVTQTKQITVVKNSTVTLDFVLEISTSPAPQIISFSPINLSPSQDEGTTNTFSVTVNQPVNSKWYLDSVQQSETSQSFTKTWSYTDSGRHTISYAGTNVNGSVSQTWNLSVYDVVQGTSQTNEQKIRVYPNPYIKGKSSAEKINFANLPREVTIRVYTPAGKLVQEIEHRGIVDGGLEEWDVSAVSSGIYLYVITSPEGTKKGKISIIK